jgi:hypothetical protein
VLCFSVGFVLLIFLVFCVVFFGGVRVGHLFSNTNPTEKLEMKKIIALIKKANRKLLEVDLLLNKVNH